MLTNEAIKELFTQMTSRERSVKKAARLALVAQGESLIPQLISLLAEDDLTALHSIQILGDIGSPQAIPHLVPFLNYPDDNIQFSALRALGKFRQIGDVEAVIRLLSSSDELVKIAAIELLATVKAKAAIEPLIQIMLEAGEYSSIKHTTVQALGVIKDVRAIEPLLTQLEDDFVTGVVIEALGSIANLETLPLIISFLSHPDRSLQYSSMVALRHFQGVAVEEAIISYLKKELSYVPAFEMGIKTLEKVGTEKSFAILCEITNNDLLDDYKALRIAAIKTLGQIGDQKVLDFLKNRLASQDSELSEHLEQAIKAFTRI